MTSHKADPLDNPSVSNASTALEVGVGRRLLVKPDIRSQARPIEATDVPDCDRVGGVQMRRYFVVGAMVGLICGSTVTATAGHDCAGGMSYSLHQIHDLAAAYRHQQAQAIATSGAPYDDRADWKLIVQKARQSLDAYDACR